MWMRVRLVLDPFHRCLHWHRHHAEAKEVIISCFYIQTQQIGNLCSEQQVAQRLVLCDNLICGTSSWTTCSLSLSHTHKQISRFSMRLFAFFARIKGGDQQLGCTHFLAINSWPYWLCKASWMLPGFLYRAPKNKVTIWHFYISIHGFNKQYKLCK